MIGVNEARAILLREASPRDVVEVSLEESHGKVLAVEILADRDFPPTDRSAMDGFAVRVEDLAAVPAELRCSGESRAGAPVGDLRVQPGEAVRIYTGAIVPPGADSVVMVETTEEVPGTGRVRFSESPWQGQHIRRGGEDVRTGERVLSAGTWIQAPEIAALAAVGKTRVEVHRLPVVHVLSTGDELVEVDRAPEPYQVRNSNAWTLLAQLRELGVHGRGLGIAGDSREELERALERGLSGDLLLVTGGVSVGTYDLVASSLARLGTRQLFHKVAMRPGKPVLAGRRGDCLVVGLPGNPVSAFTGLAVLVAPALRSMMGMRRVDGPEVRAVLGERLQAKPGRTTYHLAWVDRSGDQWSVRPVGRVSSGDVLALARANAYLVTSPDAGTFEPGDTLPAILWKDAGLRTPPGGDPQDAG